MVVEDDSTDSIAEIARGKGALVISHKRNKGVGTAFHTGVKKALELRAVILVNIDADRAVQPERYSETPRTHNTK